ncbi:hypothetical protein [Devosia sp. Root635]|uniref:hypothetical protein n=1 Tax=Devosia sp. Root635 TaxID=1736575 RepID=UPI000701E9BF|nr:hypothetical protein [Devosia sp. Root635]KRA42112.1 hypothetical protein ASD80_10325 [Devosia sp. Root635]
MTLYPSKTSAGHWLVMESAFSVPTPDDKVRGTHRSQRAALNACGRSWFTMSLVGVGSGRESWTIEENRVGEDGAITTKHEGLTGGEAHQLKRKLVGDGLVYVEGVVP